MKQGFKTTEFWITILTVVGAVGSSLADVLDPKWATALSIIASSAYSVSRAISKSYGDPKMDPPLSDPKMIDKITGQPIPDPKNLSDPKM